MNSFSILILTYNEEKNISAAIQSVAWADDVVVLDSFSTDRTVKIARENNAHVFQREFDDFGSQRNYGLNEIQFKHKWVFHLDADERFNDDLKKECDRVISLDEKSAYFVPNKIIFMGKWIKHSTQYPHPQVRLVKIGAADFVKAGHGQREGKAEKGIGYIDKAYDHYNFSKGITDWIEKHNRYSSEEALLAIKTKRRPIQECISRNLMIRKRAMKSWFVKMPFRPLLKFTYLYFFRLGLLDGRAGFAYCILQSIYEYMIVLKIWELKRSERGLSI